jgi:hypothetical protein
MVPLWMVTTAIAAGNAVILKPSERDPRRRLDRRGVRRGGLPAGILNVVHGDKEAVDAILDDPSSAPSRSSARRRSRSTSIRARPRTASACRRWAARRTT